MVVIAAMAFNTLRAFVGSPPRFTTNAARCSSASAYAASETKKEIFFPREFAGYAEPVRPVRLESKCWHQARGICLACQLPGISLLLAGCALDLLVLPHALFLGHPPGRDHGVEFPGRGAHGFDFRFAAPLLRGNKEAERFPVASYREQLPAFEVASQILTELADADLLSFHNVYSVYTVTY